MLVLCIIFGKGFVTHDATRLRIHGLIRVASYNFNEVATRWENVIDLLNTQIASVGLTVTSHAAHGPSFPGYNPYGVNTRYVKHVCRLLHLSRFKDEFYRYHIQ
jgi:hypothetical protein